MLDLIIIFHNTLITFIFVFSFHNALFTSNILEMESQYISIEMFYTERHRHGVLRIICNRKAIINGCLATIVFACVFVSLYLFSQKLVISLQRRNY